MNNIEIAYLPFASLIPSPNNSRTHSEEQIAQIAASIKQFGFNNPILIDEKNNIIAGEGRYLAVRSMPTYKKKIPTICLKHLTDSQRRAYLIADNKIAENSDWNLEKLNSEINDLMNLDFNVATMGFNNEELLNILKDTSTSDNVIGVASHTRTTKAVKDTEEKQGKGKQRTLAVLVICDSLEKQEEVYKQLTEQGLECKNTVI